jgi:hypothetical protein
MANPIYSFVDKNTQCRYFLLWDTYNELPKTVPMNLLTFLQYWGIDEKKKISVLYSIYPRLIETGTSLKDFSFDKLPEQLKTLCFDYLSLSVDLPEQEEKDINNQLENLFKSDMHFFDFYIQYTELISKINRFPRRPLNYYISWWRTSVILNSSNHNIQELLSATTQQNGISSDQLKCNLDDIHSCLENNTFCRFHKVMADFFLKLGQRNLITLDAIPHVLRSDVAIKELFYQFGMEVYLPNTEIKYDLYEGDEPLYETLNDIRYLRQFVNSFAFDGNESNLIGIDVLQYSESELIDLLEENYCSFSELVNFKNRNGYYLLPMIYTNDFGIGEDSMFFCLAPFGQQAYHIATKYGNLIDTNGYFDFHFIAENTAYLQNADDLSWIRWSYDEKNSTVHKQSVIIEDPYEENAWQLAEERFQKAIIETREANQPNKFEILELIFGEQDDLKSLYLYLPDNSTEVVIRNAINSNLNVLLFEGIDLANSYNAGIELYKYLLKSNGGNQFIPASLDVFYLKVDQSEVSHKFIHNYRDDEFLEAAIDLDRPVIANFSVMLCQNFEHSKKEYTFHFKINTSTSIFQEDCEAFVRENSLTEETDIGEYGEKFFYYLLEKGYEEVNAFTQYLDIKSIRELLEIELNQEGLFNIPVQPANNNGEDDDLPF